MQEERFDISSEPHTSEGSQAPQRRPFVGVTFACCDVYTRVYINRQRTGYDGRCPRCGRAVHFRIGPGGTNERFFTAY